MIDATRLHDDAFREGQPAEVLDEARPRGDACRPRFRRCRRRAGSPSVRPPAAFAVTGLHEQVDFGKPHAMVATVSSTRRARARRSPGWPGDADRGSGCERDLVVEGLSGRLAERLKRAVGAAFGLAALEVLACPPPPAARRRARRCSTSGAGCRRRGRARSCSRICRARLFPVCLRIAAPFSQVAWTMAPAMYGGQPPIAVSSNREVGSRMRARARRDASNGCRRPRRSSLGRGRRNRMAGAQSAMCSAITLPGAWRRRQTLPRIRLRFGLRGVR